MIASNYKTLEDFQNDNILQHSTSIEEAYNMILEVLRRNTVELTPEGSNFNLTYKCQLLNKEIRSSILLKPDHEIIKQDSEETPNTINIQNDDSVEKELKNIFDKYPPLNDGTQLIISKSSDADVITKGEFNSKTNIPHGRIQRKWPDGSVYEGYFLEGQANIKGRLLHADGDVYDGQWINGKAEGEGVYFHSNGNKYEGEWKQDKQWGKGKEIWTDGASYIGEYIDGKKEGKGEFIWSDGSRYVGGFLNNNLHGEGNMYLL